MRYAMKYTFTLLRVNPAKLLRFLLFALPNLELAKSRYQIPLLRDTDTALFVGRGINWQRLRPVRQNLVQIVWEARRLGQWRRDSHLGLVLLVGESLLGLLGILCRPLGGITSLLTEVADLAATVISKLGLVDLRGDFELQQAIVAKENVSGLQLLKAVIRSLGRHVLAAKMQIERSGVVTTMFYLFLGHALFGNEMNASLRAHHALQKGYDQWSVR
jgi:hypothetical protein